MRSLGVSGRESGRADWALSLGKVPVPFAPGKSAVLLHDSHVFYPMSDPAHLPQRVWRRKRALRAYLARSLPRQAVVFVQTQVAADRVRSRYGVANVEIIPNALSSLISRNGSGRGDCDCPRPNSGSWR